MCMGFLPVSREDMERRGWDQCDFVYVIGDAYVDHSSFGPAIISRHLEAYGYRVGIISQPDWRDDASIAALGEPRLAFLVSSGNMDSMVNHYTVNKKRRSTDAYTPGGVAGKRPDYAAVVYANLIRRTFKKTPIILGGIEASLRRLSHYDYWSNQVKRSILLDSGADLISYGMGEHSVLEIADALNSGMDIHDITYIPGTVYRTREGADIYRALRLPSYEEVVSDKRKYAESFMIQYQNTDPYTARPLAESYPGKVLVVQNPPAMPLTTQEMDDVYGYPYMGAYHPSYEKAGGVPAIREIRFSLTNCRGCFGGCGFCALTFHQGRIVQSRSHESILAEAKRMTEDSGFKGYIHDVGGPTGNFRHPACAAQKERGACTGRQCLYPEPCGNLDVSHRDYVELLRKLRSLPGVKKVFVRSGIRFDYVMSDRDDTFLKELCRYHISGQLRVAPEHVSDAVLRAMGKPPHRVYEAFLKRYERVNHLTGREQYAVPYLMSSHPGSTLKDAVKLAEYVRDMGYMPEQVQDFYPTPATISTCMYYTGLDPRTMERIYVPRSHREKAMQRALIQYRRPENYELVREALYLAGREDLIGFGKDCLIPPRQIRRKKNTGRQAGAARVNNGRKAKKSGPGREKKKKRS